MVSLQTLGEVVHRQIMGNNSDEVRITLEEVIEAAKIQYGTEVWTQAYLFYRDWGYYEIDTVILREVEKEVKNNEIDLTDLSIMRSIPFEMWIQSVGGVSCECQYIKSTLSLSKILCNEDSLGHDRTWYVVGNKIKFPQGTKEKKLPIIYANDGSDLDTDETFIPDAIAGMVRQKLLEQYLGRIPPTDMSNNSSPNN